MSIRTLIATTVVLYAAFGMSEALPAPPATESIEASINRAMTEFGVPGMAISIVHRGEVLYSGGHGILEAGTDAKVNDRTLFQIASVSKAFTAATLAILADEGKLDWDDPVINHLPEFRMHDPWVTREFTIRDLLTHRSGLPLGAGDLLIFPQGKTTRKEVIRALRYLKPSTSFRSEYAYDNLLYIVAGEVVARVAQTPFEEFLEQRLLFPLGMDDCSATMARAADDADKATPHVRIDGELKTTSSLEVPIGAAAGGINCSAREMAKWAAFVLAKGVNANGDRIISKDQFSELLKPVTLLPRSSYFVKHTGAFLRAYALGWNLSTFYGEPLLSHGGALWGMTTFLAILPDKELAVFVSNNLMTPAPRAVAFDILDQFLRDISADAGKDWINIVADAANARREDADDAVADATAERVTDSKPSLPLDAYVGTYRDAWYGDIRVSQPENGQLYFQSMRSDKLSGPLEHFQFDTFIARWEDERLNADAYVSFTLSPTGNIERIRMKAVSPATDFSFDFHDLDLARVQDEEP